ncbi:hypothetical protein OC846_005394 [Tilletia horrida]|uniref:Uncharacterized protein n=1 Tax=Tilletia horrida TaxID=155126 RepID=A0AAN6GLE0_9BASI|nr:hypothetical protein OC846_005394 [Tilletia horrida]KAK0565604.1 hypothetical protein OC861_003698 [Tilletia horrida]
MAMLDTACFTLHIHRRADTPGVTDFYDASDLAAYSSAVPTSSTSAAGLTLPPPASAEIVPLYSHHRALASAVYDVLLTDPRFGDAQVASCTAPSSAERIKTISLHNPDTSVVFAKQGGTLAAFNQGEWRVEWEGNLLVRWKKEGSGIGKASYQAAVLRSPDPPIVVGAFQPATKRTPAIVQIYDHNFHRLEVVDPRGLEIVMLTTLMTLIDAEYDEANKAPGSNPFVSTLIAPAAVSGNSGSSSAHAGGSHERMSPGSGAHAGSPAPDGARHGMAKSPSSSSVEATAPNEILITPHGATAAYVSAALNLLQPEGAGGHDCSLIELKATPGRPDAAQKAVAIAAEVKAGWYKLSSSARGSTSGELYQYIRTEDDDAGKGKGKTQQEQDDPPRRRIQLNAPPSSTAPATSSSEDPYSSYKPPSTLSILLSKDRLPELEPKPKPMGTSHASNQSTATAGAWQTHTGDFGTPSSAFVADDGPRRPPKTMSVRRNGRWTPQPVPSQQSHPSASGPNMPPAAASASAADASAQSGSGRPQHHGRRLLNKLGFNVSSSGHS